MTIPMQTNICMEPGKDGEMLSRLTAECVQMAIPPPPSTSMSAFALLPLSQNPIVTPERFRDRERAG